jgi:hypothetical protein
MSWKSLIGIAIKRRARQIRRVVSGLDPGLDHDHDHGPLEEMKTMTEGPE